MPFLTQANGGHLAPQLTLQPSPLGGHGLFVEEGIESQTTILELPLEACLYLGANILVYNSHCLFHPSSSPFPSFPILVGKFISPKKNCYRNLKHLETHDLCFLIHIWSHVVYIYIIYIPGTQMTLVLIRKDLVLEASTTKIEDKHHRFQVYIYIYVIPTLQKSGLHLQRISQSQCCCWLYIFCFALRHPKANLELQNLVHKWCLVLVMMNVDDLYLGGFHKGLICRVFF